MFIPSENLRNSLLSVGQTIRFVDPDNEAAPALLVIASSLTLRYATEADSLRLLVGNFGTEGSIIYGIEIEDGDTHPVLLWTLVESENERKALDNAVSSGGCDLFLLNEAGINVSSASVTISGPAEVIQSASTLATQQDFDLVRQTLRKVQRLRPEHLRYASDLQLNLSDGWRKFTVHGISNGLQHITLDLFADNEGSQQEHLGLWLTDSLALDGTTLSPQIWKNDKQTEKRELTDLLLSYSGGSFLIESKAISLVGRSPLPDRAKLRRTTIKHLDKAIAQLRGAHKELRAGKQVFTLAGDVIPVTRRYAPHCIALVSDVSLLEDEHQFGSTLVDRLFDEEGMYLHILDPGTLFRSVQQAHMMNAHSESGLPRIMCFDAALLRRFEVARRTATPSFQVLMQISPTSP